MNATVEPGISRQIGRHRRGFSLDQDFYCADRIFELDMEQVISNQWLLVDHESRIPDHGDYFLFKASTEELIVLRGRDDTVRAFFNVCRHRGSRLCLESEGRKRLLTCPYHAWSYDLDGTLKSARLMPEEFDASAYTLHQCHIRLFHGLIFVCLAKGEPPDFEAQYGEFGELLEFQGIAGSKIAVQRQYPTGANWKLVVENFLECYHCAPAHPEYCRVHPPDQLLALGAGPGSGPKDAMDAYQDTWDAWKSRAEALGHPFREIERGAESPDMAQLTRLPINDREFESETRDGKAACTKLLGTISERDYGETAFAFNPVSYILSFNDFAVMFRFTPMAAMQTDVQLTWLVHADAEAGVDYDPDNVAWVWDVTVTQDKRITEGNQAGIRSSRYEPGPYSQHEARVVTFVDWYLHKLAGFEGTDVDIE